MRHLRPELEPRLTFFSGLIISGSEKWEITELTAKLPQHKKTLYCGFKAGFFSVEWHLWGVDLTRNEDVNLFLQIDYPPKDKHSPISPPRGIYYE